MECSPPGLRASSGGRDRGRSEVPQSGGCGVALAAFLAKMRCRRCAPQSGIPDFRGAGGNCAVGMADGIAGDRFRGRRGGTRRAARRHGHQHAVLPGWWGVRWGIWPGETNCESSNRPVQSATGPENVPDSCGRRLRSDGVWWCPGQAEIDRLVTVWSMTSDKLRALVIELWFAV